MKRLYRFGAERSQAVIGLQMACAYVGTTFVPALFGVLPHGWASVCCRRSRWRAWPECCCAERVRTLCGR